MQRRLASSPDARALRVSLLGFACLEIVFATTAPAFAAPVLPVRGVYEQGGGKVTTGADSVTVNQISTRGVINWTSFSIGQGGTVTINNGNGATLNRVVGGGGASMIDGTLTATGTVYVMNPQGVVIGPAGVVTTGGQFLASSLAANSNAFMAGGPVALSNGGDGAVVNLGKISSSGGDVFLIARSQVENRGTIDAPKGTAELATGTQVSLQDSASGRQVRLDLGSGGTITNAGAIRAAQISLQAADGNVFALAGNSAAIRATGTALRDGHVWLVAGKGEIHANGAIGAANADKSGGTVEAGAATFDLSGATITASQWNLTSPTVSLDTAAGDAISRSLNAGTSVNVGATSVAGDIALAGNIRWSSNAALAFSAPHGISIAAGDTIANTGSGNLTFRADSGAVDNGGGIDNKGTIDWSGSKGVASLFYDMTSTSSPGTLLQNPFWTPAPFSGLVTQVTAYKLVNNVADLARMAQDLTGNYALGRDIDAGSTALDPFHPIGDGLATPFVGQFDGFGHVVGNYHSYPFTDVPIDYTGLFGVIGRNGVVRNVGVTDAVIDRSATGYFAVLAGQNNGLIENAWSTGSVRGDGPMTAGGLAGRNDGQVERSWSAVTLAGNGFMGGLVGENNGTIRQSYASSHMGSPGAQVDAGGLVSNNVGTIQQSYATSDLVGVVSGGSIAYNNAGIITESFGTGMLTGADPTYSYTGGVAAYNRGTIWSNVYWNQQANGQPYPVQDNQNFGIVPPMTNGLNNAAMAQASSFVGWDFTPGTGVWALPAGATHPVLQWQEAQH